MAADAFRRRFGLRQRVAAISVVTVGVALGVGAVLLVDLVHSNLDSAATKSATTRARDVAELGEHDTLPRTLLMTGRQSAFVQVVDRSGSVVASTRNIDGDPAVSTARPTGRRPLALTIEVPAVEDDAEIRVVALDATTLNGDVTIYAGEDLEDVEESTEAMTQVLVIGVPLLLVLIAAVTWWAVGRTLRPVRSITRLVADITATDLHRRVDVPVGRDEIAQLAVTVNATLARLDTAVEQQRRFVADASHELRGPLAALRADLEISVTHPDRTAWQDVARGTLSDVERLQQLTEGLLFLARLDAPQQRLNTPVDLAAIVAEETLAIRRDDLTLTTVGLDDPAIVNGDADQLRRMVRNLVHNAEEHANQHITIGVATEGETVLLSVGDDGPGIPTEQRHTVFERFVRLDTARTRDTGGTGLGLAIVSEVVASHHGTISITENDQHGATFIIHIPALRHDVHTAKTRVDQTES